MAHNQRESTPEERFGLSVKAVRTARGWSQEMLARRLGEELAVEIDQSGIARIESGKRAVRLNEAQALCELLGIDLHVGRATPKSEAEDLEAALAQAQLKLAIVESDFANASEEAAQLRNALQQGDRRLQELHLRRAELTAIISHMQESLFAVADARKRFDMLKEREAETSPSIPGETVREAVAREAARREALRKRLKEGGSNGDS